MPFSLWPPEAGCFLSACWKDPAVPECGGGEGRGSGAGTSRHRLHGAQDTAAPGCWALEASGPLEHLPRVAGCHAHFLPKFVRGCLGRAVLHGAQGDGDSWRRSCGRLCREAWVGLGVSRNNHRGLWRRDAGQTCRTCGPGWQPGRRQVQACGLCMGRPRLPGGPCPSLGTGWLRPRMAERGRLSEHSLEAEGQGRGRVGVQPPGSVWALPSVTVPPRDPRAWKPLRKESCGNARRPRVRMRAGSGLGARPRRSGHSRQRGGSPAASVLQVLHREHLVPEGQRHHRAVLPQRQVLHLQGKEPPPCSQPPGPPDLSAPWAAGSPERPPCRGLTDRRGVSTRTFMRRTRAPRH